MQPKRSNWADSVRAWASGYKDSVVVDMIYDNEIGFKNVYIHKDNAENWRGQQGNNHSTASANWQYSIVPTFFAIMIALIIFATILYTDNSKALNKKRKDSILNMMKGYENKKVKG